MEVVGSAARDARPVSVRLFELLGVLAAVATMVLGGAEPSVGLINLLLGLGLTLWVTRGRSKLGRLFYTGIVVLGALIVGLVFGGDYFRSGAPLWQAIGFITLDVVLLVLLWAASTSLWLNDAEER